MASTNYIDSDINPQASETSYLLNDNDNIQTSWLGRLRKPHLLWMIPFSVTLSIIMTSIEAPIVQFILELACKEFKEQNKGLSNDDDCNLPEIQILASNYVMWYTTLSHIAVTLSIGYLSTLSDYLGRKFIFRLSTFGIILSIVNMLIVAHYWRIVGIKMLYVGSIIQGLLGGVIAINTACHAYISDCTNSENRSVAFGWMHASAYCGMAIGPTIGGLIVKATGSILSIFYIALCSLITFLFVVSFILPESVPSDIRERNYLTSSTSFKHLFSPLIILTGSPIEIGDGDRDRNRLWRGRNTLYILAVIYFIYKISQAAQNEIINLYTKYKFGWTSLENGYFLSLQAFTRFLALAAFLPLLHLIRSRYQSSYARSLDIWTMRGGLTMEIIGFTLFAIAAKPFWFYFACVINSLATITTPAVRSLFTTYVLPTQAGQILGAISVLESVASILSPLWMNKLYNQGVIIGMEEIVFWANAILFIVSLVLGSLIL
ncbi:tetracycline-efflux transporter, putative [Rhizophagus clarus]|uniref:Tetracycline-efflux transporter, putative n=1 Tax=Rhizophagus clarus TaxID=94130 RepID=A0A8H3L2W0_9GLOM|nr:tetracycline-efflux transporter, putative [Rhizophagus clarus]